LYEKRGIETVINALLARELRRFLGGDTGGAPLIEGNRIKWKSHRRVSPADWGPLRGR